MKDSVPEADWLNHSEKSGFSGQTREGARPIRKRGFHRAVKRGELWALCEQGHRDTIREMNRMMFAPQDGLPVKFRGIW